MRQLSNNNLIEFLKIATNNIRLSRYGADIGERLIEKSDYGTKMEEFCINASIQLGKNILNSTPNYQIVQEFFDNFTSSNSWMDQIDTNIKSELKKNKTKTTKQNKAV